MREQLLSNKWSEDCIEWQSMVSKRKIRFNFLENEKVLWYVLEIVVQMTYLMI